MRYGNCILCANNWTARQIWNTFIWYHKAQTIYTYMRVRNLHITLLFQIGNNDKVVKDASHKTKRKQLSKLERWHVSDAERLLGWRRQTKLIIGSSCLEMPQKNSDSVMDRELQVCHQTPYYVSKADDALILPKAWACSWSILETRSRGLSTLRGRWRVMGPGRMELKCVKIGPW